MATRLAYETALHDGWGGMLAFVFQAGAPTDRPVAPTGTTTVYNDPLNFALGCLGLPAADPSAVADADVARIIPANYHVAVSLATYQLIQNIVGNFVDTTVSGQDRSEDWAKLADRANAVAATIKATYGGLMLAYDRRASSGTMRTVPPTAFLPRWGPGFGRRGPGPSYWGR